MRNDMHADIFASRATHQQMQPATLPGLAQQLAAAAGATPAGATTPAATPAAQGTPAAAQLVDARALLATPTSVKRPLLAQLAALAAAARATTDQAALLHWARAGAADKCAAVIRELMPCVVGNAGAAAKQRAGDRPLADALAALGMPAATLTAFHGARARARDLDAKVWLAAVHALAALIVQGDARVRAECARRGAVGATVAALRGVLAVVDAHGGVKPEAEETEGEEAEEKPRASGGKRKRCDSTRSVDGGADAPAACTQREHPHAHVHAAARPAAAAAEPLPSLAAKPAAAAAHASAATVVHPFFALAHAAAAADPRAPRVPGQATHVTGGGMHVRSAHELVNPAAAANGGAENGAAGRTSTTTTTTTTTTTETAATARFTAPAAAFTFGAHDEPQRRIPRPDGAILASIADLSPDAPIDSDDRYRAAGYSSLPSSVSRRPAAAGAAAGADATLAAAGVLALRALRALGSLPAVRAHLRAAAPGAPAPYALVVEPLATAKRAPPAVRAAARDVLRAALAPNMPDAEGSVCANPACSRTETAAAGAFARCARCRCAKYCSRQCQVAAWGSGHRYWCDTASAAAAAGKPAPPRVPGEHTNKCIEMVSEERRGAGGAKRARLDCGDMRVESGGGATTQAPQLGLVVRGVPVPVSRAAVVGAACAGLPAPPAVTAAPAPAWVWQGAMSMPQMQMQQMRMQMQQQQQQMVTLHLAVDVPAAALASTLRAH